MVFEIGKYYQHTCGAKLAILCELETTQYGKTLIAESDGRDVLRAVGKGKSYTVNYHEITKEEWMESFS